MCIILWYFPHQLDSTFHWRVPMLHSGETNDPFYRTWYLGANGWEPRPYCYDLDRSPDGDNKGRYVPTLSWHSSFFNLIQLIAMSWTDLNLSFKNLIHSERHNSKRYKIIEFLPIINYQTMSIQYILSWASICLQYSWQFFTWKMSNVYEGKIQHIALFENLKLE